MLSLQGHSWKLKYTPDGANLVRDLYVPLLARAVRYDRLTGYFNAQALALAARGVEGLVHNNGTMRMIVGCTLQPAEVQAIERGSALREQVAHHLVAMPLTPLDEAMSQALELLAWLVAQGRLDVKIAVPCDETRRPFSADGIFHEKAGIAYDSEGESVAFNGSLNETAAGWTKNWESVHVFTSWKDPDRVETEAANFSRLWADKAKHVITVDIPTAVKSDLLRFLPENDLPARLKLKQPADPVPVPVTIDEPEPVATTEILDPRRAIWSFIASAPTLPDGGERVGETTSAIIPWPHQRRAFHRLYDHWPPKLLIADEVGLGKTIQAGLLLRQAWLAHRARRILILAPKAVCRQWQIELREKFNLNWPIYDGKKLSWCPSPALGPKPEKQVSRDEWYREDVVIASSHLMRRRDRVKELLDDAQPWDLVILDEAHHARRQAAGSSQEGGPNALLRLMQRLKERTQGLVLLTATPMQVAPVEVYDLLALLGLPREWREHEFLRFFEDVENENPSHEIFNHMARMFQAVETAWGQVEIESVQRLGVQSRLKADKVLKALRDQADIPRNMLSVDNRKIALRVMRRNTPISRLISRNTRELLRKYYRAGKLKARIAERKVEDSFITLSPEEREIYDAVESYIANTYNQAISSGVSEQRRSAIGFVMTIYRRRLASSFLALRKTLEAHLNAIQNPGIVATLPGLTEGVDDENEEEIEDDDAADLTKEGLVLEEKSEIEYLIDLIRALPAADTKCTKLRTELASLRAGGYSQAMVFTQFTDTMDFLRSELARSGDLRIMCFSGRGGEIMNHDGTWHSISRDDVKRRFRLGETDILLCTDAAAEGLNFQFCGALINYDMPWNPMRVEQRIGRIDRLGQKYPVIRIINLHYADTVEADVYQALRSRIGLFEKVVGGLQPILAKLPELIASQVLTGDSTPSILALRVDEDVSRMESAGTFDIDTIIEDDMESLDEPESILTMCDLDKVISNPKLMPETIKVGLMGDREYKLSEPAFPHEIRVTTDPSYYEENSESVEFWSPGNPTFPENQLHDDECHFLEFSEVLQKIQ